MNGWLFLALQATVLAAEYHHGDILNIIIPLISHDIMSFMERDKIRLDQVNNTNLFLMFWCLDNVWRNIFCCGGEEEKRRWKRRKIFGPWRRKRRMEKEKVGTPTNQPTDQQTDHQPGKYSAICLFWKFLMFAIFCSKTANKCLNSGTYGDRQMAWW